MLGTMTSYRLSGRAAVMRELRQREHELAGHPPRIATQAMNRRLGLEADKIPEVTEWYEDEYLRAWYDLEYHRELLMQISRENLDDETTVALYEKSMGELESTRKTWISWMKEARAMGNIPVPVASVDSSNTSV